MAAGADVAQRLLVSATVPGEGPALFEVDVTAPGLHLQPLRTFDGRGGADVVLEQVVLPGAARLGAPDAVAAALDTGLDHAIAMSAAEAVGAMAQALRITRDHLAVRRQFGAPLAEFQALRHRLAEMYAELAVSRALVRRCVGLLGADPARRRRIAAACNARVGRASMFVANQSVQLHGGIGMTDACAIGRYYRRLFALSVAFGTPESHLRRFADLR